MCSRSLPAQLAQQRARAALTEPSRFRGSGPGRFVVPMAESHVITARRAKRAEISGHIAGLERKLARHRANLANIDATIRLSTTDIARSIMRDKRFPIDEEERASDAGRHMQRHLGAKPWYRLHLEVVAPIRALIVPKWCSTVSRRCRIFRGRLVGTALDALSVRPAPLHEAFSELGKGPRPQPWHHKTP